MAEFIIIKNVTKEISFNIPPIKLGTSDNIPETEFSFNKTVYKYFSIIVPDFVETITYDGYVFSSAEISDTITMVVDTPSGYPEYIYEADMSAPDIIISGITKMGPVTYIYPEEIINCDIVQGRTDSFAYGGPGMWIGVETTGGIVTGPYKTWIPFQINEIPQAATIINATFSFAGILAHGDCDLMLGCDKRPNAIPPTDYNELYAIVMTDDYYEAEVDLWQEGTVYTIDITTSVQEIINLATPSPGWIETNTLGILIVGGISTTGYRYITSLEHPVYAAPTLTIIAIMPVPY